MYDFVKSKSGCRNSVVYRHPQFKRGQSSLAAQIRRKSNSEHPTKELREKIRHGQGKPMLGKRARKITAKGIQQEQARIEQESATRRPSPAAQPLSVINDDCKPLQLEQMRHRAEPSHLLASEVDLRQLSDKIGEINSWVSLLMKRFKQIEIKVDQIEKQVARSNSANDALQTAQHKISDSQEVLDRMMQVVQAMVSKTGFDSSLKTPALAGNQSMQAANLKMDKIKFLLNQA